MGFLEETILDNLRKELCTSDDTVLNVGADGDTTQVFVPPNTSIFYVAQNKSSSAGDFNIVLNLYETTGGVL